MQLLGLLVVLPVAALTALHESLGFDPCDTVLTKFEHVPAPGGLIWAGRFFMGLSAVMAVTLPWAMRKPGSRRRDASLVLWVALWLAVFGAAATRAGHETARAFEEEARHEARQARPCRRDAP